MSSSEFSFISVMFAVIMGMRIVYILSANHDIFPGV